jgi:hypothetical protein
LASNSGFRVTPSVLDVLDSELLEEVAKFLENEKSHYKFRNVWRRWILYTGSAKLRASGMGVTEVARVLSKRYGLNVRSSTITNWDRRYSPIGRNVVPLVTPELGYLLGAAMGDGSANLSIGALVFQNLADLDFAESILQSARTGAWIRFNAKRGTHTVIASNKILCELVTVAKSRPMILLPVLTVSKEVAASAIAGFFDADGTVGRSVEAIVTRSSVITLFAKLMRVAEIHHTRSTSRQREWMTSPLDGKQYRRNSTFLYRLVVRRCCTCRFARTVGFRILRKQSALEEMISKIRLRKTCS